MDDGTTAIILILLIAVIAWAWGRHKKKSPATPDQARGHDTPTPKKSAGVHYPATPTTETHPVWGRLAEHVEVEGEFARPDSFKALLGDTPGFHSESGAELRTRLQLTPDPENPYGPTAVAVWTGGHHVGYMPAGVSVGYSQALQKLGRSLDVPGRVWARVDETGRVRARADFRALPADKLEIIGDPAGPGETLLPEGGRIQVQGEEAFRKTLSPLVPDLGETMAWVRLKVDYDFRPRSAKKRVEVYLGDEQVGWLSDTQSANVAPVVEHVNERDLTAVARAVIGGSPLKAEVVLYVAKSGDVTREWLASLGEPTGRTVRREPFEWDDADE